MPLSTLMGGRSQADLARYCSVSPVTAHLWVRGKVPLPAGRVNEVAEFLGVEPSTVRRYTETTLGGAKTSVLRPDTPRTLLDTLLRDDVMSSRMGATWAHRVGAVAETTGASMTLARNWVLGRRLLPVDAAKQLCARWWPGVNPVVFSPECGERVSEEWAVDWLVKSLANDTPDSFEALMSDVERVWSEFRVDPVVESAEVSELLDDGREVHEWLLERAAVLQARRRVEGHEWEAMVTADE